MYYFSFRENCGWAMLDEGRVALQPVENSVGGNPTRKRGTKRAETEGPHPSLTRRITLFNGLLSSGLAAAQALKYPFKHQPGKH